MKNSENNQQVVQQVDKIPNKVHTTIIVIKFTINYGHRLNLNLLFRKMMKFKLKRFISTVKKYFFLYIEGNLR